MAVGPLLETKLYVPRWRPGLVSRPRLIERLNQGAQRKLTLVSAPAGFGKTTLLAEWLAATAASERRRGLGLARPEATTTPRSSGPTSSPPCRRSRPGVGESALSLLQLASAAADRVRS